MRTCLWVILHGAVLGESSRGTAETGGSLLDEDFGVILLQDAAEVGNQGENHADDVLTLQHLTELIALRMDEHVARLVNEQAHNADAVRDAKEILDLAQESAGVFYANGDLTRANVALEAAVRDTIKEIRFVRSAIEALKDELPMAEEILARLHSADTCVENASQLTILSQIDKDSAARSASADKKALPETPENGFLSSSTTPASKSVYEEALGAMMELRQMNGTQNINLSFAWLRDLQVRALEAIRIDESKNKAVNAKLREAMDYVKSVRDHLLHQRDSLIFGKEHESEIRKARSLKKAKRSKTSSRKSLVSVMEEKHAEHQERKQGLSGWIWSKVSG